MSARDTLAIMTVCEVPPSDSKDCPKNGAVGLYLPTVHVHGQGKLHAWMC